MTALEDTLSMRLDTGLKPLFVRYVKFYLNVLTVEVSVKYFTEVYNITLDDHLYSIKITVFASIDLIGNVLVESTYIVPFLGFRVAWYAKRFFFNLL